MLLLSSVIAAVVLLSPAPPVSITILDPEPFKALFERGAPACAICSIDSDSAATAETLRELQDLRRARDVNVLELSMDPARVSGDEVIVNLVVRLGLSECEGPGGWHEARIRHYLASLRRTGAAWELRTFIWREETLAAQLVEAEADERATLLAANPELVGGELARALYRRCVVLLKSASPANAESIAAVALDIAQQSTDRGAEALLVFLQSVIARRSGRTDLAATLARESLAIAQENEDPDVLALAWNNRARMIKVLEDHSPEEEAALIEARHFAMRAIDRTLLIRVMENLAARHGDLGDNVTSRQYYDEIQRLSEATGDVQAQLVSNLNLAYTYADQLDFELALRYATRGRDLAEDSHSFYLDRAAVVVAWIQANLDDFEPAELALLRVIQAPRSPLSDHDAVVLAKQNLAYIYLKRGDESGAECLLREAVITEGREYFTRTWLCPLSEHALDRGDAPKALALALEEAAFGHTESSARGLARVLTAAGRAYRRLGMIDEARACFAEAVQFHDEMMRKTTGPEDQQVKSAEEAAASYREIAALLVAASDPWKALDYAERGRARILRGVRQRAASSNESGMTPAERETEQLLTQRLSTLNLRVASAPAGDKALASLLRDLSVARSDLRALYEQIYARNPQVSLERRTEIRALARDLPQDLLFCEYVITSDEVILFVLEPSAVAAPLSTYRIPIKKDDLRRRVESFTKLLSKANLNFERPSRELFDLLLAPVASRLSRHKVVAIAPDGVLWRLPFAALIDESRRYVIEKTAISYAPSLQVLIELEHARGAARKRTLLAVGNPTVDRVASASVTSLYRDVLLGPLPDAETEVQALGRIYGPINATILTRTDATETVVVRDAPNNAVLHFATHGIFDDLNPMYSRLMFASSSNGDDGFLEAWEIANTRLDADLVVLSACETALGRETDGEGLVGMTWAFFVAGARSVLSTQWKVDSESASQLMVRFHQRLRNSATADQTARALRHSQISLIRESKYRHPYHWAAYTLTGSSRISGAQNRSQPTLPSH